MAGKGQAGVRQKAGDKVSGAGYVQTSSTPAAAAPIGDWGNHDKVVKQYQDNSVVTKKQKKDDLLSIEASTAMHNLEISMATIHRLPIQLTDAQKEEYFVGVAQDFFKDTDKVVVEELKHFFDAKQE